MNAKRQTRQCESTACSHRKWPWRAWLEPPPRGLSLDGHWYCSSECFQRALISALEPLLAVTARPQPAPHRVPLGLLMLSRGTVDNDQLKTALKAQKDSGSGRVGEWLRHIGAVTEEQVTQALGLQWSIPVFPLDRSRRYLECAHLVPFPLLEAVEMIPVHYLPASRHLYMAFVDRINYTALYSVEKMLDCHTEQCLASQSHIQQALNELRSKPGPAEILVDKLVDPGQIAEMTLDYVSRLGAEGVRVSGFGGFIWIRILAPAGFSDLLFQVSKYRLESDLATAPEE